MSAIAASEARTRVCPIRQCSDRELLCLAENCMAWRLVEQALQKMHVCDDQLAETEPPRPADVTSDWEWFSLEADGEFAGWVEPLQSARARDHGYCGLVPLHKMEAA